MKQWIVLAGLAVLAVGAAIFFQGHLSMPPESVLLNEQSVGSQDHNSVEEEENTPADSRQANDQEPTETDEEAVGVDELMRNVDHYEGRLRVIGVVSGTSTADHTVALIDIAEFEECGITTCASLTLPVQWSGPMPSVEDTVEIAGEVQELEGRLIFVAETLEKVE